MCGAVIPILAIACWLRTLTLTVGNETFQREVPQDALVIGYSHHPSGFRARDAITKGVNVICWAFIHLETSKSGDPTVRTDLDLDAVRSVRESFPHVLHMAAVGGWNAPHPPTGVSAEAWRDAFISFNAAAGFIFDGLDWDLEGHDNRSAPTSKFSLETLDIMADVSVLLRERGYALSMAPAESYLDSLDDRNSMSLDLNLFPEVWLSSEEDQKLVESDNFAHAGRQCYAYVLHRAGVETFDWVAVQLYEAWSRFLYESTHVQVRSVSGVVEAQARGLQRRTEAFEKGVSVDLMQYGMVTIVVPRNKLVWGFANNCGDKFVRVQPQALEVVMSDLESRPRGLMFWTIEDEGKRGEYLLDYLVSATVNEVDNKWEL